METQELKIDNLRISTLEGYRVNDYDALAPIQISILNESMDGSTTDCYTPNCPKHTVPGVVLSIEDTEQLITTLREFLDAIDAYRGELYENYLRRNERPKKYLIILEKEQWN